MAGQSRVRVSPSSPHNLTPHMHCAVLILCSITWDAYPFVVNFRAPALNWSGPLAMVFRSRSSHLAIGLHVSNAWGIGSSPSPSPCFINPITLRRRAYRTRASAPPLAPRIYTFRDLMKKPPHQQTEADKFQEDHAGEKISTQDQSPIDEKYEVSCLAESAPLLSKSSGPCARN